MFTGLKKIKSSFPILVGNILDHFDTALYGFMAPFIAPLIFPKHDPIISLMLAYGLLSTSLITRPLGSYLAAKYVTRWGASKILALTLLGVALCTGAMGLVPIHSDIGILSPLFFAFIRALQGLFAAAEHTIAGLLLIQQTPPVSQGRASSFFHSSSVLGILMASAATTLIYTFYPQSSWMWRVPFIFGFFTGLVSLWMRLTFIGIKVDHQLSPNPLKVRHKLYSKDNMKTFLKVIVASGFTYLTYAVPFLFLNGFVPQVTSIPIDKMMMMNTLLLVLDMCILPFFGFMADAIGHRKIMFWSSTTLALTIIPSFYLIPHGTLLTISLVRIWIILLGLSFLAPLHAWFYKITEYQNRFLITGVGYSIGSELFGRNIPSICFFLYYTTKDYRAPAVFIAFIGLATAITVILEPTHRKKL